MPDQKSVQVLEILGLPFDSTEKSVRIWLEKQVGRELSQKIKHVSLMSDVEYDAITDIRNNAGVLNVHSLNAQENVS